MAANADVVLVVVDGSSNESGELEEASPEAADAEGRASALLVNKRDVTAGGALGKEAQRIQEAWRRARPGRCRVSR